MSTTTPVPVDFGPLVTLDDVSSAVVASLAKWLPTYLAQIETERSLHYTLPRPRAASIISAFEITQFTDGQLPVIVVLNAGTEANPILTEDYSYLAIWDVLVNVVVRGRRASETQATASFYEAAIRRAIVQHKTLDDQVMDTRWMGVPRPITLHEDNRASRYLGNVVCSLRVWTDHVVQEGKGPRTPDVPFIPLAQVTEVDITVEGKTIEGQFEGE